MPQPAEVGRRVKQLTQLFQTAQADIDRQIRTVALDPTQGRRLRRLQDLKRTVDARLSELEHRTKDWLEGNLPHVYELGGTQGARSVGAAAFEWTQPHVSAVEHLATDMFHDVLDATTHVRADVKAWVREEGRRQTALSLLEGRTAEQAGQQLAKALPGEVADLIGGRVGVIQYADGSVHTLADYSDMLLRTKTAQAYNAGTVNTITAAGVEWLECLDGEDCGWTDHDDEEPANGKIVTADEAAEFSLSHPRCQRSFIGRPDITNGEDAQNASPSVDPASQADQAQAEQDRAAAVASRAGRTPREPRTPRGG